jgi:hypothetical protein
VVIALVNDPDYLIRLHARAALEAIAPDKAIELGIGR